MSSLGSPSDVTPREKRAVEVELSGRRFRVRSDDDDAYIRRLVEFLNRKMGEVRRAANAMDVEQIALLTLLDMADTLFRERARAESLERGVRERAERIALILERLEATGPRSLEDDGPRNLEDEVQRNLEDSSPRNLDEVRDLVTASAEVSAEV